MIKLILVILLGVLGTLQYKLWVEKQGVPQVVRLKGDVVKLTEQNAELEKQNKLLQARVENYRRGTDGFEERAREDLSMVKKDEVFYQVVPKK